MSIAAYRDRITGAYPVTLDTIRATAGALFGDVPPRSVLDALEMDPVEAVIAPVYDSVTQTLAEGEPAQDGAMWRQTWMLTTIPPRAITATQVDAERDRRIDAGFRFAGISFQSRAADRENILGAASLAHMALTLGGKQPGDLRWDGSEADFVWIALDNSLVPMDAPTVIAFGQAAATHKAAHTFAARTVKDIAPIPEDFADDRFWPAV